MNRTDNSFFDWYLWFLWIMATTLGWVISQLLLPSIGPVIAGFPIGILQWFVLRNRIKNSWRWTLATGIGWAIGLGIVLYAIPLEYGFLYGITVGATTGIAQWFILRGEVLLSGWWIVISIIGWFTGLSMIPGLLTTGTMAGLLTGVAIELLLRNPKPVISLEDDLN
ncbi:MAG: hypothetical protein IMY85_00175 [Chloroflexi bacterium]|nr:hypothetical protein [Chloroflexota bacterium]